MITMTEATHGPAFQTVSRGVSYYLRTDGIGRLELSSKRLAMATIGQVRHFRDLGEVEQSIKAFRGLSALVELGH